MMLTLKTTTMREPKIDYFTLLLSAAIDCRRE
jgi:hypothetical protein